MFRYSTGPTTLSQRFISRGFVVLVSTTVATWIPSFVIVVSLIGCFSVGLVAFIFPPLFHLRLMRKVKDKMKDNGDLESSSLLSGGKRKSPEGKEEAAVGGADEVRTDRIMLIFGVASTIFTTSMTLMTLGDK